MKTTLRDIKLNENGDYVITCKKHYFKNCSATKAQKEYFNLLGGKFEGTSATTSQIIKKVTKRDMSVAIELLKKGEKVIIYID